MRKIIIINILIIVLFILHPTSCLAVDNQVEDFLSEFRPEKVQGRSFEEAKENYRLVETRDEAGGIIAYDIAENGNIAVITGEREYLTIYDSNMKIIGQYNPRLYMEGVRWLGDYILIFTVYDTCGVYDQDGNLLSIYTIVNDTEDVSPYEKYESVAREIIKKRDGSLYYISDRKNRPPSTSLGIKHQYNYLVRVDENGERVILLDRGNELIMLIIIPCLILFAFLVFVIIKDQISSAIRETEN